MLHESNHVVEVPHVQAHRECAVTHCVLFEIHYRALGEAVAKPFYLDGARELVLATREESNRKPCDGAEVVLRRSVIAVFFLVLLLSEVKLLELGSCDHLAVMLEQTVASTGGEVVVGDYLPFLVV